MLADADVHRGTVRVLYQTLPSLPQTTQPGWTVNVYVALLGPDGSVENRRIATGQRHYASLVLRRGADEAYVLPAPERRGEETVLERRSLADGSVVGTIDHAWIARARGESRTVYPTADGGVFLTEQSARSARSREAVSLAWKKFSPVGAVVAEGRFLEPTALATLAGVFPVDGGGLGMTVSLSHRGGEGHLATDIPSPIVAEVGGRRLEAWAFAETRALVTGPGGAVRWVSPALERQLMWEGEMSIPDSLPMDEILAQNSEQMALMERTALEYAGERQVEHQAHWGFDELKPTGDGWGMLARQVADQGLDPPMHGTWFLVLGADGRIARQVRLEAAAEAMDARFERFLPAPGGGVIVAGRLERGSRLLRCKRRCQAGDSPCQFCTSRC